MTKRRPIDLRALRGRIQPVQVLDLFDVHHWKEASGEVRGPCPVHGSHSDQSRSFACNAEVCYCQSCKFRGDAVALYARLTHKNMLDAAYELCDRLSIDIPYLER
jgi:DNA primase